jgi:hypothetical protein
MCQYVSHARAYETSHLAGSVRYHTKSVIYCEEYCTLNTLQLLEYLFYGTVLSDHH